MKILVLGGTGFLGPEVVEALVALKHTVTLFNRGKTHPGLFPDLEKLQGDRAIGDLKSLEGREWDAVIDIPAIEPKWVKGTCELLAKKVKTYAYVSTISVFNDYSKVGLKEDGQTHPEDKALDDVARMTTMGQYGPMKVRSEAIVREYFPQTATVVRPGLIVGPTDKTDRFTYWPARIDKGGDVLAPGPGTDSVQYIDLRDLGAFIAKLVTEGHSGTYNATGPAGVLTMSEFLGGCKAATSTPVTLHWADPKWLEENGVKPFQDLPMWAPGDEMAGFMRIDCSKAIEHGLAFRPLAVTARDTMDWVKTTPWVVKAGLKPAKEAELIKAWKEKK